MSHTPAVEEIRTLADLLNDLGGVSPHRVLLTPAPGEATVEDLIRLNDYTSRLYELVDGVLVEKVMGLSESIIAVWIGSLLQAYLNDHDLGLLAGADGAMRLWPGLVRIPDLSFISWKNLPVRGEIPKMRVGEMAPDLAVEVLSEGNTREEMDRKLKEYFMAGVQLV